MALIVYLAFAAALVFPLWRICTRAGFPGALALVALIPWLGLVIVGGVLSFAAWKQNTQ